ncbi:MAG: bifunctional enoyl-CoA hydratase/phosphate acetyltransferase [Alkalispirochaetaceae bacterium]
MSLPSFSQLLEETSRATKVTVAVGAAADREVLEAVSSSVRAGYCRARLFGPGGEVERILHDLDAPAEGIDIVDVPEPRKAAEQAVRGVRRKEAQLLMKGLVETSVILEAVLDKEEGLRGSGLLSHIGLFEIEGFPRVLAVTDSAMNIDPDLEKKRHILKNGVAFLRSLGLQEPKVAVICARETVSEKMPCTLDARTLVEENLAGKIEGCLVAGPYALDNAVSREAAALKGIEGAVAGEADLLVMPDIEAGKVLYKALSFLANSRVAGLVVGAAAPIVLTSRADSAETKRNSLALAARCVQP